jgi:hypothetical protein
VAKEEVTLVGRGTDSKLEEQEEQTLKTVHGTDKSITFRFPTKERLEADAKSGNADKEKMAKKLMRFEAAIDEARKGNYKGLNVKYRIDTGTSPTSVPAADIVSVDIYRQ